MAAAVPSRAIVGNVDLALVQRHLDHLTSHGAVPGIAVGIWHAGAAHHLAAGVAANGRTATVNEHTGFAIGCLIKLLTSMLLLRWHVNRRVDLDESLAGYLPELQPALAKHGDITLRHVLSHTAGYVEPLETEARWNYPWERFVEFLGSRRQAFPPGTVFSYTQTGAALLAAVITRIEQRPALQVLQEQLLEPAGIRARAGTRTPNTAAIHVFSARSGRFQPIVPPPDQGIMQHCIANLALSTADLLTLGRLLTGSAPRCESIFPAAARALMLRTEVSVPAQSMGAEAEILPTTYGLGIGRFATGSFVHNGSFVGTACAVHADVEHDVVISIALNAWRNDIRDAVMFGLLDQLAGRAPTPREIPLESGFTLDDLQGTYKGLMLSAESATVTADGCCEILTGRGAATAHLRKTAQGSEIRPQTPWISAGAFSHPAGTGPVLQIGLSAYHRLS